jgi:hypothetical protein
LGIEQVLRRGLPRREPRKRKQEKELNQ